MFLFWFVLFSLFLLFLRVCCFVFLFCLFVALFVWFGTGREEFGLLIVLFGWMVVCLFERAFWDRERQ